MKLVECVPNFSTSDPSVIEDIVTAIEGTDNTYVLHSDPDSDYNRTVITFVSDQRHVVEAGFAGIEAATNHIDMRKHHGEHPRLGATDVFPLIPLKNSTFDECISLAHDLAFRVGEELSIPTYCYGKAAKSAARRVLSDIRKSEYEGLETKLRDPLWEPDFGPASFNAKAGACVIGVRDFLIAYNVNLDTDDINTAIEIARTIRTSGWYDESGTRARGLLDGIQAMGVSLYRPNRGHFVQVSTNILDYVSKDSIHNVYETISRLVKQYGIEVTGSEVVGLLPIGCVEKALDYYDLDHSEIDQLIDNLGLNDLYPFDPGIKILEKRLEKLEFHDST